MRAFLVQTAGTALAVFLLYAALIGVSFLLFPPPWTKSGVLDTFHVEQTIYETPAKYVLLGRSPLEKPAARAIMLGASNTAEGFPLRLIQREVPDAEVNNMAVNGANLDEIHQVFKLASQALSPADRARTVYVIGLWYGLFIEDKRADAEIDNERYRYGFYRQTPNGPAAVIPEDRLWMATTLIYPLLVLDKGVRIVTTPFRERFLGAKPSRSDSERDAYVATPQDKQTEANYWAKAVGTEVSPKQFQALEAIVAEAQAEHSAVVILDLPIPAWHSAALPYDAKYHALMGDFVSRHASDPHFHYVNMRGMNTDAWFCDEVHPKPRVTPLWVHSMAGPTSAALQKLSGDRSAS